MNAKDKFFRGECNKKSKNKILNYAERKKLSKAYYDDF